MEKVSELTIYEVMDRLSGLLDDLVEHRGSDCDEDELNYIAEIENRIYKFVYKYGSMEG